MFYVRSLTFQGSTKYYFVSEDWQSIILQTSSLLLSVQPEEEWPESHHLQLKVLYVWTDKTNQKFMYSQWHCHWKLFLVFHVFPMLLSPSTKQNFPHMYLYLKSAIRKLWLTCNIHNDIHLVRSNEKGYGCKTHYIESLISSTKEPRVR
jgi:hypothetical protein